jgi:uncharacterized protein DUF6636
VEGGTAGSAEGIPRRLAEVAAFVGVWIAIVAFAACGDGDDDGTTVTVQETETEVQTTTEQTGTEQTTTEEPQAVIEQREGPRYFQTPSRNIGCIFGGGQVRCDIRKKSWPSPPAPASCELDYGQGISLSAGGEASFVCAGDTALGGPATLAYGSHAQRGFLRCDSERNGVTCLDVQSGGGFFLSKESYRFIE